MKNTLYRQYHNQFFFIFKYDELIEKTFRLDEKPIGWIKNPPHHSPFFVLPSLLVCTMSIIYIKQFDWIQDYTMYQAMTGLFPKDGLHYLLQGLIIWSLNSMFNGFYASSRRFEDYDFLLPIRYEKYRKLNDKNQKKFNLLRDRIFSMIRIESYLICALFLLGKLIIMIQQSSWKISIFWSIIWLFIIQLWTNNANSGKKIIHSFHFILFFQLFIHI